MGDSFDSLRFPEGTLLAPAPALSVAAAAAFVNTPKAVGKTHTVRAGDTLFAIARKYGVTVEHLLQVNGLKSKSVLRMGQKLRL
jgi:LysM repeat protein